MSQVITVAKNVNLVVHECWSCAVVYGIPERMHDKRLEEGGNWYCPNGHSSVFKETEAQRLNRLLKNAEQTSAWERQHREEAERSLSATRGVVTKLRKRTAAGACPFGCRRHFVNLERHVATKHAGQTLEGEAPA